jgi:putative hydrolase of the HAD superfamily
MVAGMRADGIRAILLDALGTLVELVPPWPALVRELDERGVQVSEARAREAMLAEMAFYRAHHAEAGDAAALADLRARCARVLGTALGEPVRALGAGELLAAMMASLRFVAYPEAEPVLRELRSRDVRLVVVSNWDVSLHEVLARTGLAALVDGAVTSAELGVAKPDPAIFAAALELAGGVAPRHALHAGDSVEVDVAGARTAGLQAVLVRRDGDPIAGVRTIRSLDGLLGEAS